MEDQVNHFFRKSYLKRNKGESNKIDRLMPSEFRLNCFDS